MEISFSYLDQNKAINGLNDTNWKSVSYKNNKGQIEIFLYFVKYFGLFHHLVAGSASHQGPGRRRRSTENEAGGQHCSQSSLSPSSPALEIFPWQNILTPICFYYILCDKWFTSKRLCNNFFIIKALLRGRIYYIVCLYVLIFMCNRLIKYT